MKKNKTYDTKGSSLFGWVCLVTIILLLWMCFGCNTQKHINTEIKSSDITDIKERDSLIAVLRSEISELTNEINQLRYAGVSFQDRCDTAALRRILTEGLVDKAVIDDYLKQLNDCSNEVEIAADGSIKAKGKLKEAFIKEEIYKKAIARWEQKYDSLAKVKQKEVVRVVTKTEKVDRNVKRSFFGQWWLFPAGMIFMAVIIYRRKIVSKLRPVKK